mgnify:CR=1 FL=1
MFDVPGSTGAFCASGVPESCYLLVISKLSVAIISSTGSVVNAVPRVLRTETRGAVKLASWPSTSAHGRMLSYGIHFDEITY